MWLRRFTMDKRYMFTITANAFIVEITGGSVIMRDRNTKQILKKHKGYNYLYTGDISPDETECFALENGKHFYIYSLKTFEPIKKITLPRCYESIDVCGHYSDDGRFIEIPVHRWINGNKQHEGHYEYLLCKYETDQYTLVDKSVIPDIAPYIWLNKDLWGPLDTWLKQYFPEYQL